MDLLKLNAVAVAEIVCEVECAIAGISSVDRLNFHLYKDDTSMPEYQCIRALRMSDAREIDKEIKRSFSRREPHKPISPLYRNCRQIAIEIVGESIADEIAFSRNNLLKAIQAKI